MAKVINTRNGKATKASQIRDMLLVNFEELLFGPNGNNGCVNMELTQDEQDLVMGFFQVEMVDNILEHFFNGNTKLRGMATNYYKDLMRQLTTA